MNPEAAIDGAIRELERAKATWRHDPEFARNCLTEARMEIAAARTQIEVPTQDHLLTEKRAERRTYNSTPIEPFTISDEIKNHQNHDRAAV